MASRGGTRTECPGEASLAGRVEARWRNALAFSLMAELTRIRNFCVIAHVDHGKTTLSDRLLEMTGTVPAREMREQLLDSLELEREHGITIKARAVRIPWTGRDG